MVLSLYFLSTQELLRALNLSLSVLPQVLELLEFFSQLDFTMNRPLLMQWFAFCYIVLAEKQA